MGVAEVRHGATRASAAIVAVAAAAFAHATAARADTPKPPPTPGISQYVETLPTSSGGKVGSVGTSTKGLGAIANSPAYAAPQAKLRIGSAQAETEAAYVNAVSAAVGSVDGGDDSHFIWLGTALLVLTVGAIVAATRSTRRRA
jgi:hypothetical protein